MIHPRQTDLLHVWNALRDRRSMPRVADVTMRALSRHVPDLVIIERNALHSDVLRLAGTACCALFGHELTGGGFQALWQTSDVPDVSRLLQAIFDEASPVCIGAIGHRNGYPPARLSCMLLPIAGDDQRPARVLGSIIPTGSVQQSMLPVEQLQLGSVRFLKTAGFSNGIHAAGVPRHRVALQRGHLVLLKSSAAENSARL